MAKILAALLLFCCAVPARALRAVSLLPSYTEIIFELGAGSDLVGVSNFCNWPAGAAAIEKTGDYLRPNIEKVYALQPDVVFTGAWAGAAVAKQLSSLGVKVVSLPEEKSVADILNTVRLIAAALGRKKEGEALARKLAALAPKPPAGEPVKLYIEVDAGGWTTGGLTFISDAARLAGGRNVFGGEKRGFFQASWEETLLLDPEAALLFSVAEKDFLARPMAGTLAAVKDGRVITTLDRDAFTRPGPRLFGEIARLRSLLHGKN
ncbi:MAG: ABC transporter substrate-binding protein [Elusimicrobiales bacterium]